MKAKRIIITLSIALLLFSIIYFINPFSIPPKANLVLATMLMMLTLWFSEALHVGLVSLIPLILFPAMNIFPLDKSILFYLDKMIFLFFGGFVLGLSIEKWNLHKRIALGIVKITGTSPNRIILGFTVAVGFLSMWLSNTATAMMMLPIAASVVSLVELNYKGKGNVKNFNLVLMLLIAYAASIGGFATIIGTPPNVVMRGLLKDSFGYDMGFMQFSLFAFPLSAIMLSLSFMVLTYVLFPNKMEKNSIPRDLITEEYKKLGKMSKQEWIVSLVFLITCLLWICRPQVSEFLHWANLSPSIGFKNLMYAVTGNKAGEYFVDFKFDDTFIAMLSAIVLFIIPADRKKYKTIFAFRDLKKMQWSILFLFGGGLCIAKAMEKTGLMNIIGDFGADLGGGHHLAMIVSLTVLAVFVTEVMSNVALVTVMAPVVGGIALSMNVEPVLFVVPVTIGASCAFMSPIGTPPNAIVYASGKIKLYQMAKAGFVLNIIASVLIAGASFLFIKIIF